MLRRRLLSVGLCVVAALAAEFKVVVHVANIGKEPLKLFWVSPQGQRILQGDLLHGRQTEQRTFAGHTFEVTAAAGRITKAFTIRGSGAVVARAQEKEILIDGDAHVLPPEVEFGTAEPAPEELDDAAKLFYSHKKVDVSFSNRGSTTATVSWIRPGDEARLPVGTVNVGQVAPQATFTSHFFEIAMGSGLKRVVKIRDSGTVEFGDRGPCVGSALRNLPMVYRGRRWSELLSKWRRTCSEKFAGDPASATHYCSPKFDYRTLLTSRLHMDDDQEFEKYMAPKRRETDKLVASQPQKYQNFSEVGFKVMSIPAPLHEKLLQHWRDQRHLSVPELDSQWDLAGYEGRSLDVWMAFLPKDLEKETFDWIREMVSEWVGVPEKDLTATSLYGMRMYHRDSNLGMHLDKERTHALSAILEVARNDPFDTVPWPLRIYDHSGQEHIVPDRVGQLILYESATCSHGRDTPFLGRQMANVFVHFAPVGWPEQYTARGSLRTPREVGFFDDLKDWTVTL